MPDNTEKKQDNKFRKGKSGNPNGRPKGALNKATMFAQQLLDNEAELITRKVIELALQGDISALKMVLERILPPRKDTPVNVGYILAVDTINDLSKVMAYITKSVLAGSITPSEGKSITEIIENYRRTLETEDLEKRITKLEEQND